MTAIPRRILLADADAFYVAVARLVDPDGAGKAPLLIVGGSRESRGVVCSASYETRKFGVRSAMPTAQALKLCPQAMCVPVPRGACSRKSAEIRRVLQRFTPIVEGASIDEWYLDMDGTEALYEHEPLERTAHRIRAAVREATALSVSIGGGTNKLVAKMAVEVAKPKPDNNATGVHVVSPGDESSFLKRFLLAEIPLIGPKFQTRLERAGLRTVNDVLDHPLPELIRWFGDREGQWLWDRVRGIDDWPVEGHGEQKSMSREETFATDIGDDAALERELFALVARVASDLRSELLSARTIRVKIKDADFTIRQANRTLPEAVVSDRVIFGVARELLHTLRTRRRTPARLIGIALTSLVSNPAPPQLALFEERGASLETERDRTVARTVDVVRRKFGQDAIGAARLSRHDDENRPLRVRRLLALIVLLALPPVEGRGTELHGGGVALVLSGGGAKGLVHIGVLEVMDSLGIRPNLVVGTSMGAIVGALYASGYSGRQIDSLAHTLPLSDIFRSFDPVAPRSFEFLQPLLYWEQGERGFNLQRSAASIAEANAITNNIALRGNLLARGSFDSLPIPFRAVATNLADRSLVVLGAGDLARALRASYAIPLIFPPEKIDGKTLGDGGLVANIPVGVARSLGATRLIVSDATAGVADSVGLNAPLALASHLVSFLFHQDEDSLRAGDVLVRGDVAAFPDFELSPRGLERLVEVGRVAARKALTAPSCAATSVASRALPRRLGGFHVQAPNRGDRAELRSMLGFAHTDTINPVILADRLRRLASSERFAAVWLNPRGAGDTVAFDLAVQRQPARTGGIGLAYDQELGGRAWVGYSDHRMFGSPVEGSVIARVGTLRDELLLALRGSQLVDRHLFNPMLTVRLSREDIRRFNADGNSLATALAKQGELFAGYEHELRRRWWLQGGGIVTLWDDSTRSSGSAAGVLGSVYKVDRDGDRVVHLDASWTSVYGRASGEVTVPLRLGELQVTPRVRYGWGHELPAQLSYTLGGDEGFPGLHIGELRGDREAYASTLFSIRVLGPLQLRVRLATGAVAHGGDLVPTRGWLAGARGGVGLHTPVGPIVAEYGYNSLHRGAIFIRVGRWF